MSRGLVASLAVHAVVVTAMLIALPSSELLPALFIDLTAVDPSAERAGPASVPPPAVRTRAQRQPEASAPTLSSSAPAAVAEAPALPEATSVPSLPSVPPLPPPMVASPDPPAEPASSTPALSVPPAAEPESPSASAALSDTGGRAAPPEPSPAHPGGGSASSEAPSVGLAVAPEPRSLPPSPGHAAGGGAGAGQELARRSRASDGDAGALYTAYLTGLRQRIHAALRYPPMARRRGLTGAVTIELTILPSGMIRDVSIVTSSAHRLLDEAAVETVRELGAQPFPASVPPRLLRVRLPIVFELQ